MRLGYLDCVACFAINFKYNKLFLKVLYFVLLFHFFFFGFLFCKNRAFMMDMVI